MSIWNDNTLSGQHFQRNVSIPTSLPLSCLPCSRSMAISALLISYYTPKTHAMTTGPLHWREPPSIYIVYKQHAPLVQMAQVLNVSIFLKTTSNIFLRSRILVPPNSSQRKPINMTGNICGLESICRATHIWLLVDCGQKVRDTAPLLRASTQ